jgi:hypothetical protein
VRFEDGTELSVHRALLRARWAEPLRALVLWGDYYPARIVDVLAGCVLRLSFGGADFRWALIDDLLSELPPETSDLRALSPDAFVACAIPRDGVVSDESTLVPGYCRAQLLQGETDGAAACTADGETAGAADEVWQVLLEDGSRVAVPRAALRLPRSGAHARIGDGLSTEKGGARDLPKAGQVVFALFGRWCAASIRHIYEQRTGRVQATMVAADGACRSSSFAPSEVAALDGGDAQQVAALSMGAPVVAHDVSRGLWDGAVYVQPSREHSGWLQVCPPAPIEP